MFLVLVTVEPFGTKLTSTSPRGQFAAIARCTKARAWFTFAGGEQFHLLAGESNMSSYQWTPPGRPSPGLTYRFCKTCGVRIYGTGDAEFMGGRFYALAVATFDNVSIDELAAAPLRFIDNRHDRFDRAPEDTRLM